MRKLLWLIVCLMTMVVSLTSCETKEEKCAKLIKNELFKTLYDFDSYQPIETKVSEAKGNIYNDSSFWKKAEQLGDSIGLIRSYVDRQGHLIDLANIFMPTYFSSSFSDRKFREYNNESKELGRRIDEMFKYCEKTAKEMLTESEHIDTTKMVGYEVIHSFRCKTKDGNNEIAHLRYLISKDFKKVILREDLDKDGNFEENPKSVLEKLEDISKGHF